jgi:hypothetical protein
VRRSGREVLVPPLVDRIAHAALVETLLGPVGRAASPSSFAYLPGRDRITALGCAKKAMHAGFWFAAKIDVSQFFPSTTIALVRRALRQDHPEIDLSVRRLVAYLFHAPIVRPKNHEKVVAGTAPAWEPPRDTLLAGPSSAPLLSEIVGHHVVDRHFGDAWLQGAILLRYADDILVLGRTRRACRSMLREVVGRLEEEGFTMNAKKSVVDPIDLRADELSWLGKTLHQGEIHTNPGRLFDQALRLDLNDIGSRIALLTELTLDPVESFRASLARVESLGSVGTSWTLEANWTRRRRAVLQRIANHARMVVG